MNWRLLMACLALADERKDINVNERMIIDDPTPPNMNGAMTEPPQEAQDDRIPHRLFVLDIGWPADTIKTFEAPIPYGAAFQRVYRADVMKLGKRRPVVRMVFLSRVDADAEVKAQFALQRVGDIVKIPTSGDKPVLLGTIVDNESLPIGVWLLPTT